MPESRRQFVVMLLVLKQARRYLYLQDIGIFDVNKAYIFKTQNHKKSNGERNVVTNKYPEDHQYPSNHTLIV